MIAQRPISKILATQIVQPRRRSHRPLEFLSGLLLFIASSLNCNVLLVLAFGFIGYRHFEQAHVQKRTDVSLHDIGRSFYADVLSNFVSAPRFGTVGFNLPQQPVCNYRGIAFSFKIC